LIAALLLAVHVWRKPAGSQWVEEAHESIRSVHQAMRPLPDKLKPGARVLFLCDPFPADEWALTFLFRLHYGIGDLWIDRVKHMRETPDSKSHAEYDLVLAYEGGRLESGK
jgi:hypothetical protein